MSARETIDRHTPEGRLQTGILAEFSEFERAKIRARTSAGIGSRARSGKPWGEPAYGYRRRDDGHWQPDPLERTIVERIFRERTERGASYCGIAKQLNAESVPSRRGTKWTASVVAQILTARTVLGYFKHVGEWHQGQHEPIISDATWQAAQALAEQGRRFAPSGRAGRLPARHLFIRGTLRCGQCGAAMLPRTEEAGRRETYVCRTRKQTGGAAACSMPVLRRAAVDGPALALFERVALDVDRTREHLAAQLDSRIGESRAQASRAERDVTAKRVALARFDRDYEAGELAAANYERLVARVREELTAAEAEAERLTAHADEAADGLSHLDAESEALRRLAELRRAVAGRIRGAEHYVNALRAAWGAVFAWTEMIPDEWWPAGTVVDGCAPRPHETDVAGGWALVPMVRPEMLDTSAVVPPVQLTSPVPAGILVPHQRVALGLGLLAADNYSGSGVPEYPAMAQSDHTGPRRFERIARTPRRRSSMHTVRCLLLAVAASFVVAAPAGARGLDVDVIADELDNPRHVAVAKNGDVYVAEAGEGGNHATARSCFNTAEGFACTGRTGAITRISRHRQERVVDGLASFAPANGDSAIGPHGVFADGNDVYFTNGGPTGPTRGDPPRSCCATRRWCPRSRSRRCTAACSSCAGAAASGRSRMRGRSRTGSTRTPSSATTRVDSNPVDVLEDRGRFVIADAGGNTILRTNRRGRLEVLSLFRNVLTTRPGFPTIPMQAVPTGVVKGPDGFYYVSQLTGFPFPPGGASVFRVDPRTGEYTTFASGFTNIMDLDFGPDGTLYVLEIDTDSLVPEGTTDGGLWTVSRSGTSQKIALPAGTLTMPGGIAVGRQGKLYVSNRATENDVGEVLRIDLGRR